MQRILFGLGALGLDADGSFALSIDTASEYVVTVVWRMEVRKTCDESFRNEPDQIMRAHGPRPGVRTQAGRRGRRVVRDSHRRGSVPHRVRLGKAPSPQI